MTLDINDRFIYQKIDEYLLWLYKTNLVTDKYLLNEYSKKLHSLKIKEIFDAPGDARITFDGNLEYCVSNITLQMLKNGEYYIDEVLFHEFTHVINSFHKSLRGKDSFIIRDAIENKMDNFTNAELLTQEDKMLYNQDPCFGVILLDEYVAQSVAQEIVGTKYNTLDYKAKQRYAKNGLSGYQKRNYTTIISEPPYHLVTSLGDYQEYDLPAKRFIDKYLHISHIEFIKRAINGDLLRNIIANLDFEEAEEIYSDLCYMGIIEKALAKYRGFINIKDKKDPVNNPRNVYKAYERVLKK
jgi:hypothetical protein